MAKRSPSPSPWTTYTPGIPCGNKDRWIVDGKGRTIAVVWFDKNTPANARLIAAAPNLLAGLEAVLECVHNGNIYEAMNIPEFVRQIENILAKAKGN
jgi:hypothetical protein